MQCHDVRLSKQRIEGNGFTARCLYDISGNHRVEHQSSTLKRCQSDSHFASDPSESDDTDRLIPQRAQFTERRCEPPFAVANMQTVLQHLTSRREYERECVIGHLIDTEAWHIAHGNAPDLSRFQVHVVHTDPIANDDSCLPHRRDDFCSHRRKLRDDRVGIRDECRQLRRRLFLLPCDDRMSGSLENFFFNVEVRKGIVRDHNFHRGELPYRDVHSCPSKHSRSRHGRSWLIAVTRYVQLPNGTILQPRLQPNDGNQLRFLSATAGFWSPLDNSDLDTPATGA